MECYDNASDNVQLLVETPRGRTAVVSLPKTELLVEDEIGYNELLFHLLQAAKRRDLDHDLVVDPDAEWTEDSTRHLMLIHNGRIVDPNLFPSSALFLDSDSLVSLQLKCRGRGGMDRQNRVGSKFGGGGVSSSQNAERERKERLKRLALESIDLAKDPYLMRNHLGTYECKLCLTLHTNEANYLAHTQGKKHQQGLAKRAYMEKLKQEKEQAQQGGMLSSSAAVIQQPKPKKIRIGRPAYQVFKSRDPTTNQRCLSFELQYPEIEQDLQPRHRFMSAFEQRVESPPDRRFQYLLFAAEPYETVAFKIPNESIDKGQDRFVTHWDDDDKKFTLSLYFVEQQATTNEEGQQQQEQQQAGQQ
ncbi:Splicing factor 3A subunit 2 [Seminavis robusta]|uniref:Splicing factor 3A subunit 2 n=1 Tax=Seminavis robusta TaxID=568900 RepID=A0A9N8E3Y2_9STRA|nr:Splicing factor 3A subunit 2 [Seminavis robusta]|eukprot:Sro624_g177410.1 Splicing factor 3A subunit 2 (360) ;mRNA; f:50110-51189